MKFLPEDDGITHINVYSQGKTQLGQLLSNFAYTPFTHPEHGSFLCIEGWWYWIMTGDEALRKTNGFKSKQLGKTLQVVRKHPTPEELRVAYIAKLEQHSIIKKLLQENTLPLAHYYVYGGKVVVPKEWLWTAELWTQLT